MARKRGSRESVLCSRILVLHGEATLCMRRSEVDFGHATENGKCLLPPLKDVEARMLTEFKKKQQAASVMRRRTVRRAHWQPQPLLGTCQTRVQMTITS